MKKLIFVLAAQLYLQSSWAQQDTTLLNEAVVTASKFPTKTIQTGKVVSIINAEQLAMAGERDLAQVLQQQAGIFIGGANSNPGKDKSIYLWGASPVNTLILIDGLPVYDPSGIGGNFDIRNLSIKQLERIEIVKGSQSTLYGSDAIAGVINFITKRPPANGFNASANAGYGSYDSWKSALELQGAKGKWDYTAGYSFFNTKGINETIDLNNSPIADKDGYRQQNVHAGLGTKLGEHIKSQLFFRYGKMDGSIDQGAYLDELDYTYTQRSTQAGIRNEASFKKLKFTLLYQYNIVNRTYIDDSIKSRNGFDTWSKGQYEGGEHMIDLYANYSFKNGMRLLAGADWRRYSTEQFYLSLPAFGPLTILDTSSTQKDLYAHFYLSDHNRFQMELGGRLNFHSAYGNQAVYTINPSWSFGNGNKLFANISSSYRTPSLYQLYSEYGNASLDPEYGKSIEAGVQLSALRKNLTTRLVAFQRNTREGIFFYFDPVTYLAKYINQDRQKDHGLEWEMNYRSSQKLSFHLHYNYVTGKIHTKENGKDTSYNNLLRRPEHQASLAVNWKAGKQWLMTGSLSYNGKRKDAWFNSANFSTERVTLPSYVLLNIYLEYKFLKLPISLFADGRNLTGTDYMEIAGFRAQGLNGSLGIRWSGRRACK